ncbi:hypothetical protein ALC57_08580 [Trachymyrmex cornetzi]|uniref:Uncharacterized protein n=1 Tax=Trachymyrmex cornetzi TaxID=471704 RepID=A0A151J786_9HYME|nr:hypothetical protein ALC57_08580 [Trachymyrmex cornetzi]
MRCTDVHAYTSADDAARNHCHVAIHTNSRTRARPTGKGDLKWNIAPTGLKIEKSQNPLVAYQSSRFTVRSSSLLLSHLSQNRPNCFTAITAVKGVVNETPPRNLRFALR